MDEEKIKLKHERSVKDFPQLKLEKDEYVEFTFSRAKVCLFMIILGVAVGLIVVLLAFLLILLGQGQLTALDRSFMYIILAAFILVAVMAGIFAVMVYRGNKLFVTNKHVIQTVKVSPFAKSFNMIDLASVEDASFRQNGLLQTLFHYGTFRLSTVGDETTYTFEYSDISPTELKAVSKIITDAKEKVGQKKTINYC